MKHRDKVAFIDFIFENKESIKLSNCHFKISPPFQNHNQLIEFVNDCDILCGRDQFLEWDKSFISSLPELKFICTRSTGYNHIDWEYAASKGIPVCNVPGYGANTVAEYAVGLALNVMRCMPAACRRYRQNDYSIDGMMGFDLQGKTAGIIGSGSIGREMIKICNGFSMQVFAFDSYPDMELQNELNFTYIPFDVLLKQSDLISVHIPLSRQTYHLIDEKALAVMKPSAVLVNTSRGEIVDTEALINALKNKQIFGAGLDVIEGERKRTYDFSGLNAVVSTHNAWYTVEAIDRITNISLANIRGFIDGKLQNCINREFF